MKRKLLWISDNKAKREKMVKGSFGNTPRKRLADISNFQEKKSKPTTQVEKPLTIPPTTKEYIEHLHQVLLHCFQLFCFWGYCVLHVKWLLYLIWFFGNCDPGKYGIGKASCRPKVSFTFVIRFFWKLCSSCWNESVMVFYCLHWLCHSISLEFFWLDFLNSVISKIIEVTGIELQKLRISLQKLQQQNLQLAQANSQMLAVCFPNPFSKPWCSFCFECILVCLWQILVLGKWWYWFIFQ